MNKHKTRAIVAFIFTILLLTCYLIMLLSYCSVPNNTEEDLDLSRYRDKVPEQLVDESSFTYFINCSKISFGVSEAYANMYPKWADIFRDAYENQGETKFYLEWWETINNG